MIVFDFDPNIIGIAGQPFRFEFTMTDDSRRSHMPDYSLGAADGGGIVVDIKPDELIDANDRIKALLACTWVRKGADVQSSHFGHS